MLNFKKIKDDFEKIVQVTDKLNDQLFFLTDINQLIDFIKMDGGSIYISLNKH